MKKLPHNCMKILILSLLIFLGSPGKATAQDARLPNPDFSEMEKWYQVLGWTYEKYGTIKMDIQAKNNPPQTNRVFVFKYFDKDNKEMGGYTIMGVGYSTPKGQVEHVEAYGISEDKIKNVKSIAVYRLNDDGSYTGPAIATVKQTPVPAVRTPGNVPPAAKDETVNANAQAAGCNFNVLPALNSRAPFSEALVKSALYERYSFEANTGGLSSPLAVGLTFLNIKLLNSYTNTVTVVPGRGAQRKHDGAPVNATIYRFHAKYVVCKKYNNATTRTQYESDNVCFKATNGNWACAVDGVPKIVHLD